MKKLNAHIQTITLRISFVGVLIVCAMLVCASSALADSGFSVNPMMVKQSVSPGKSTKQNITILNTFTKSVTYTITREDFGGSKSDPSASPVLYGGIVDTKISGAGWLNPSSYSLTIGAGQSKVLTVTTKVPKGASGGHFGAIVISSSTQTIGTTIGVRSQVAVLFLMNSGTSTKPPEIIFKDVVITKPGTVDIVYKNNGDTYVQPKVKIIYRDPITGQTITETKSATCDAIALPDSLAKCTVKTKPGDSTSGITTGEVELAANGVRTKAKLPTEWTSPKSSMLAPLAGLGLLALYFLKGRRRKGSGEDEAPDF